MTIVGPDSILYYLWTIVYTFRQVVNILLGFGKRVTGKLKWPLFWKVNFFLFFSSFLCIYPLLCGVDTTILKTQDPMHWRDILKTKFENKGFVFGQHCKNKIIGVDTIEINLVQPSSWMSQLFTNQTLELRIQLQQK